MSVDPLAEKYNWMTGYQFSSNQVVHAPEIEGMENYNDINEEDLDFDNYPTWGVNLEDDKGNQIHTPNFDLDEVVIGGGIADKEEDWDCGMFDFSFDFSFDFDFDFEGDAWWGNNNKGDLEGLKGKITGSQDVNEWVIPGGGGASSNNNFLNYFRESLDGWGQGQNIGEKINNITEDGMQKNEEEKDSITTLYYDSVTGELRMETRRPKGDDE